MVLVPLLLFAPESAWWLIREGRVQEARKTLKRTCIESVDIDIDIVLVLTLKTDLVEREIETGTT